MATLLDIVKKGSTDRSVTIRIINATTGAPETSVEHNTSGIDLWYRREGAAKTSITEAALSALTDAHSDGGIEAIGNGEYRLDLPDAAFATGANHVDVGGTVTGMIVIGGRVRLVDFDPENAVRMGMTALPNAAADAAGGLPISDAGGLDLDAKIGALTFTVAGDVDVNVQSIAGSAVNTSSAQLGVNVVNAAGTAWGSGAITAAVIATGAIDADAIADNAIDAGAIAANAITSAKIADDAIAIAKISAATYSQIGLYVNESMRYVIASGTIGSVGNDTTHLHLDGLTYGNDELNDHLVTVYDNSANEYHTRWIEDWADTGDLATLDAALPFTPEDATDFYYVQSVKRNVTGGSGLDAAGVRAAIGMASANMDTQLSAIVTDTNELQGDWTNGGRLDLLLDATLADTNELQTDWANGGRLDVILDARASQTSVDDLPTNAELATSQAAADDATLAAIAALSIPTVAQIRTEIDSNSTQLAAIVADTNELQTDWANGGRLDLLIDGLVSDNPNTPARGVQLSNLMFMMVDATDLNTPETGVTVTATISKDGGAFASCTNAVSEVSGGWYKITLTSTEMTADAIAVKFTGTGCAQRNIYMRTQPT